MDGGSVTGPTDPLMSNESRQKCHAPFRTSRSALRIMFPIRSGAVQEQSRVLVGWAYSPTDTSLTRNQTVGEYAHPTRIRFYFCTASYRGVRETGQEKSPSPFCSLILTP